MYVFMHVCMYAVCMPDYKKAFNKGIKTKSEYESVATVAQDRVEWKSVNCC